MNYFQDNNQFVFYSIIFFGAICLFSGLIVIITKNPINSVIFLILVFCRSSCLLICVGVEFIAMIFLVVYVGAIAVLFLFVVIILQIKLNEIESDFFQYAPVGSLVGISFLFQSLFILNFDFTKLIFDNTLKINFDYLNWFSKLDYLNNLEIIGQVLYTHFLLYFLLAGIILLVAIIRAIALTINVQENKTKRQLIFQQLSRNVQNAIFFVKNK